MTAVYVWAAALLVSVVTFFIGLIKKNKVPMGLGIVGAIGSAIFLIIAISEI